MNLFYDCSYCVFLYMSNESAPMTLQRSLLQLCTWWTSNRSTWADPERLCAPYSSGLALLTVIHLHSEHSHRSQSPPPQSPGVLRKIHREILEAPWVAPLSEPSNGKPQWSARQAQCLPWHFMQSSLPLLENHIAVVVWPNWLSLCWWSNSFFDSLCLFLPEFCLEGP